MTKDKKIIKTEKTGKFCHRIKRTQEMIYEGSKETSEIQEKIDCRWVEKKAIDNTHFSEGT